MTVNSRQLARTWPHRRYRRYEKEMRETAAKWFEEKGLETHGRWSYCLARHDMWPQNIIRSDVVEYIGAERKRHQGEESFPLHKYLHHGLSSQAMVFNLIGPLIVRKDLEPLREACEGAGIVWPSGTVTAGFEYDDREVFNEDSGQPTSIDLVVSGEGKSLFVESKLVEKEFGGCSVFAAGDCNGANPLRRGLDQCYLHHIGRDYWNLLRQFGFASSELCSGPICPFTCYYQFFREALFSLAKGGILVLLYDGRSPVFVRTTGEEPGGLWTFLIQAIPEEHRPSFARLTIQQVVEAIDNSGRHTDWLNTFRTKYGLQPSQDGQ